ncbi:MAG: GTP-binding protein, partial [Beijerinckiaceae bacterium]
MSGEQARPPVSARSFARKRLRFMTCGSVDDGKSTLIGRLLHDSGAIYEDHLAEAFKAGGQPVLDFSFLVDGLKAEREQGITIDVAYRYFATAQRSFLIADAPGHEQYTRNQAAAASQTELALVLISAIEGVRDQTRRHLAIASLFGVADVVVAINKMDA